MLRILTVLHFKERISKVFIDDDELLRLLANYDPESGTSPSVADSRPVLRAILDKVSEV
jgi:hypothetical protein